MKSQVHIFQDIYLESFQIHQLTVNVSLRTYQL